MNFARQIGPADLETGVPETTHSKWGDEQRIQNFKIRVDTTDSYVDEVNIRKFLKCMIFMMKAFYNVETRLVEQKIIESFLHELKCFTLETLHKFLNKKANKYLESIKEGSGVTKAFEYSVKTFNFKLLDETGAFLGVEVFDMEGVHSSHANQHETTLLRIKNFKVSNLLKKDPLENVLLKCLKESQAPDSYNFTISLEKFATSGKLHENRWKVFNNIDVSLETIVVNFSLDVFEKLYDFIWMNQLDNPLFMDANDRQRDSELAETFFWNPNNFFAKKKEICKKKKKDFEESNRNSQQIKSIPSLYRRFTIGKTKIYLNYKSGFKPLVC